VPEYGRVPLSSECDGHAFSSPRRCHRDRDCCRIQLLGRFAKKSSNAAVHLDDPPGDGHHHGDHHVYKSTSDSRPFDGHKHPDGPALAARALDVNGLRSGMSGQSAVFDELAAAGWSTVRRRG
jgi:hypothetical protein